MRWREREGREREGWKLECGGDVKRWKVKEGSTKILKAEGGGEGERGMEAVAWRGEGGRSPTPWKSINSYVNIVEEYFPAKLKTTFIKNSFFLVSL